MKKIISILFLIFSLISPLFVFGQTPNGSILQSFVDESPKREVRAVWMTTLGGLDWPRAKASTTTGREKQKAELCQKLDELARCGINLIFMQTRIRGSVIYPSKIEPWDVALTGKYDTDPGYDPLKFAIEECHKRGMEFHAWIVTIPAFKISQAKLIGKKSLIFTNPTLLKKQGDTYYMDPGQKGTADYLAKITKEIVTNYDVDGVHYDYIRYPENPELFPDGQAYKKFAPKGQDKKTWRRENITRIVRECYKAVQSVKSWVRVSCSPIGKYDNLTRFSARGWAAYSTVYQDAQGWLKEGIMDMLAPMMYFKGDHFYPFAADWQEKSYGRTIVPGLGIYFMSPKEKNWDLQVITREMQYLRTIGVGGQAFFRGQFLLDNVKGLKDWLTDGYYNHAAIMPAMTWKSTKTPHAPEITLKKRVSGVEEYIEWKQETNDGVPCRYVIYASREEETDVSRPENIIRVTWDNNFKYDMLTTALYGLHLAITTLDAYGNESEKTQVN